MPRKGSFEDIQALSDERKQFIADWLIGGKEVMALARYVQEEWKEFGEMQQKTLCQKLTRWRKVLMIELGVGKETVSGAMVLKTTRRKDIDVEERLCALIELQQSRLLGFLETEGKLKTPMAGVGQLVESLKGLLQELQKHRFDTGKEKYEGPNAGVGKMGVRTLLPDGTVVEAVAQSAADQAAQKALEVLDKYKRIGAPENDAGGGSPAV